jgi:hypothetical protein
MRKAQGCKEKRKPDDDRMARVLRALRESMRGRINRRDPLTEQLRQCPEAFKVGEILGKAIDSFKYGQDEPSADRLLPPPGAVIPPLV